MGRFKRSFFTALLARSQLASPRRLQDPLGRRVECALALVLRAVAKVLNEVSIAKDVVCPTHSEHVMGVDILAGIDGVHRCQRKVLDARRDSVAFHGCAVKVVDAIASQVVSVVEAKDVAGCACVGEERGMR